MRDIKLLSSLLSLLLIGVGGLYAQANDLCGNAQAAMPGDAFTVSTTGASGTGFPGHTIGQFGGADPGDPGVWYEVSGFEGIIEATTCDAVPTYDTRLSVFSGSCTELNYVDSNDDFCGLQSRVSFQAQSDVTYYVYLSGFGGGTGTTELFFNGTSFDNPGSDDVGFFIRNNALEKIQLSDGLLETVGIIDPNPPGFVAAGEVIDGDFYAADINTATNTANLIALDTSDASQLPTSGVPVGLPAGFAPISISQDPGDGTVYMVAYDFENGTASSLYTLDVATGAATFLGTAPGLAVFTFAINEDGMAYGIDVLSNVVFQFDLSNFSVLGTAPLTDFDGNTINIGFAQDTDFDCSGNGDILYGILYDFDADVRRFGALDPMTGVFLDLPSPINAGGTNVGAFAIDCVEDPLPLGAFSVNLTAINEINLTLNDACVGKVTPRMVLVGDFDTDDNDGIDDPAPDEVFTITVLDDNPDNGMVVDGCGRFIWTAEPAVPDSILSGFIGAWGYVNAEDKTSPELDEELEQPSLLFCEDVDQIDISQLPSSVDRCWIQSGSSGMTLDGSMNPLLRQRLLAGGGIPNFTDGCSDVQICVNDIVNNTGPCNDVVLTRTFTATDGLSCDVPPEGQNPPAIYSYDITFTRPTLDDVVGVDPDAIFNCDDQLDLLAPNQYGDENPAPEDADWPFFDGPNGPVFLVQNFCNIGATFVDGPRIETCPQTYKFVRTFTVIDWCDTDTLATFAQLVKVGDFEAPVIEAPTQDLDFNGIPDNGPLVFSTTNDDCTANFIVPAGDATDNCDPNPSVFTLILPFESEDVAPLGPFPVGSVANSIPKGDHTLRYIAVDACENSDTLDVPITIADRTAPVAICEDGLDISVGGANSAILTPDDIDRASYDDCTDIFREIALFDPVTDAQLTPWMQSVELTCDDIPLARVGLRVTDDGNMDGEFTPGIDNSNVCWLDVLVEDKVGPICIAPGPVTVTCDDEDLLTLPQDLGAGFDADPVGVGAQLNALFGEGVGLDNCPDPMVDQDVVDLRNSCGVGTIIRTFVVTDGAGFTSPPGCQQVITVLGIFDYTIQFPGDAGTEECIEPDYNGVDFEERGCDLLTVTTRIDTFEASADECYKLRITYEVLNWCEYSTEEDPYVVPRDADNDDVLEEDTWLHVLPNSTATTFDDVAWLDRDGNRFNGFISPLDEDDPNGQVPGSSSEPYGTDESRGAFLYRQFIKVYDDVAPEITVVDPDGPFTDDDGDCVAPVTLEFSVFDDCTSVDDYDAEVELDAFFEDVDGDGFLTLADFVPASGPGIPSVIVTPNGDGSFDIDFSADLPLGRHAVRITADDGCGNTDIALIIFEVVDNKAPTPICINGLTATLMPDGNGGGMAEVWALEFIASDATDCTGPVEYAIYFAEESSEEGFEPMVGDTGITLTCDELGVQLVTVHAIDGSGQSDRCEVTLTVQQFQEGVCPDDNGGGNILGNIVTPNENGVANVEVSISDDGSMDQMVMTGNDGNYSFTSMTLGDDYTVSPELVADVNVATAVTTMDVLMINRHILGIDEFDNPYQHVVADVTMEGDINVIDVVNIRMVIMGQTPTYLSAPSWRFADASFDFGTDASQWAGMNFPEVYNINDLPGDVLSADFIALEMGNVSEATINLSGDMDVEARSSAALQTNDVDMTAGNTYDVSFTAADLLGFQGTLEIGAGLELVDVVYGQLGASHMSLHRAAEGLITFSYDNVAGVEEGALFTLQLRATTDVELSEMISITDRITAAEAYPTLGGVANLGIDFGTGLVASTDFVLDQNNPNPVVDRTKIAFNLPEAGQATLTIRDVQGRTLMVREIEAAAGQNVIDLDRSELRGAAGVLSYTLTSGDFTATRQMIVLR
ncbi:MAG: T9SS type A sorting domain-containing protein [Bacteroidota bacterium]